MFAYTNLRKTLIFFGGGRPQGKNSVPNPGGGDEFSVINKKYFNVSSPLASTLNFVNFCNLYLSKNS